MVGSSLGVGAKVLAKQPASVAEIDPSGHQATKSSGAGSDPICRVNVVVVLPVPDSRTIRPVLTPALVAILLQPACRARPPRSKTRWFHMRRPRFLDSPK